MTSPFMQLIDFATDNTDRHSKVADIATFEWCTFILRHLMILSRFMPGKQGGAVESIHVSYRWCETIELPDRRNAAGETHHDVKKNRMGKLLPVR